MILWRSIVTVRLLTSASPIDELPLLAVGFPVKCYGVSDWLKPVCRSLCFNRPRASHWTQVLRFSDSRVYLLPHKTFLLNKKKKKSDGHCLRKMVQLIKRADQTDRVRPGGGEA